jgi:hypothetical protein
MKAVFVLKLDKSNEKRYQEALSKKVRRDSNAYG